MTGPSSWVKGLCDTPRYAPCVDCTFNIWKNGCAETKLTAGPGLYTMVSTVVSYFNWRWTDFPAGPDARRTTSEIPKWKISDLLTIQQAKAVLAIILSFMSFNLTIQGKDTRNSQRRNSANIDSDRRWKNYKPLLVRYEMQGASIEELKNMLQTA